MRSGAGAGVTFLEQELEQESKKVTPITSGLDKGGCIAKSSQ